MDLQYEISITESLGRILVVVAKNAPAVQVSATLPAVDDFTKRLADTLESLPTNKMTELMNAGQTIINFFQSLIQAK